MKIQNLFRSAAVITCILITTPSPAQKLSGFETPPLRKSSEVLPPSLIQGEHFRVRDQVTWKEGLHVFTVDSDFGPFEVWGEPMLRVCLREVDALFTLSQTSSVTAR